MPADNPCNQAEAASRLGYIQMSGRNGQHFYNCFEQSGANHGSSFKSIKGNVMRNSGKAPTMIVWVISLVLFVVALVAHFGLAKIPEPIATWSWIVGLGLLLAACRIRGL